MSGADRDAPDQTTPGPPPRLERLLAAMLPPRQREFVCGDLAEEYAVARLVDDDSLQVHMYICAVYE